LSSPTKLSSIRIRLTSPDPLDFVAAGDRHIDQTATGFAGDFHRRDFRLRLLQIFLHLLRLLHDITQTAFHRILLRRQLVISTAPPMAGEENELLAIGFVERVNRDDPRIERFLHIPHDRILGDSRGGDLLPFHLPLLPLVGGRRRRQLAHLKA